jgi:ATP-dependent RNA helicase DDX3X
MSQFYTSSSRYEKPTYGTLYNKSRGGDQFGYKEDGLLPPNPTLEQTLFRSEIKSKDAITFESYEDIPVSITGKDYPPPISTFEECKLGSVLENNLKLEKFSNPTPIQKNSIPISLAGRDMMACAQTGSGKTASFLFPIISKLIANRKENDDEVCNLDRNMVYPFALLLAPTRELAIQIHNVAKKFTYRSHLLANVVYGGSSFQSQARELSKGCHILVATPGRLIDMIDRYKVSLEHIKFLIFDEADRMLDMGFEEPMRNVVFNYGMPDKFHRQTSMFSATFPNSIRALASDFLNDYIFVTIGRVGSANEMVTQSFQYVEEADKKSELLKLLKSIDGKILIFAATKRSTDHLGYYLHNLGFSTQSIHGDRTQIERENAIRDFKGTKCRVLVATDVASRGLDIDNVGHVINFDLPSSIDDYVHRIGRTGRCGRQGMATAFLNKNNQKVVKDLVKILSETKQQVPDWLIDMSRGRYGNNRRGGTGKMTGKDWRKNNNYNPNNNTFGQPKVHFNSHYNNTTTTKPPTNSSWYTSINDSFNKD